MPIVISGAGVTPARVTTAIEGMDAAQIARATAIMGGGGGSSGPGSDTTALHTTAEYLTPAQRRQVAGNLGLMPARVGCALAANAESTPACGLLLTTPINPWGADFELHVFGRFTRQPSGNVALFSCGSSRFEVYDNGAPWRMVNLGVGSYDCGTLAQAVASEAVEGWLSLVFDYAATTLSLSQNGVLIGTSASMAGAALVASPTPAISALLCGANGGGNPGGYVETIALATRALTAGERKDLFAGRAKRASYALYVDRWTASRGYDSSPARNDLLIRTGVTPLAPQAIAHAFSVALTDTTIPGTSSGAPEGPAAITSGTPAALAAIRAGDALTLCGAALPTGLALKHVAAGTGTATAKILNLNASSEPCGAVSGILVHTIA